MEIYIIGICGTGVGPLAGLLQQLGHRVRGSDAHVYPPMSTQLAAWGIPIHLGYDVAHLQPAPALVIVGNVIRRDNVEATWVRQQGIPTLSMPQAVAQFGIGDKHSIVIAGTHGKTTVAALTAHLLRHAGGDPSYLVGGVLCNYPTSFQLGKGAYFVVEGDEYDTAYFDKGPKFWHYRAQTAVITSLEFDHADIFASIEAVEQAFAGLIARLPASGQLIVWHGATRARRLIAAHQKAQPHSAQVLVYAAQPHAEAQLTLRHAHSAPAGLQFEPLLEGVSLGPMQVALWGDMAACNVLAALAAVRQAGLSAAQLRAGFASFQGVRRRMEVLGEPYGVCVVDDFAHHPTAVQLTLAAARSRWPQRRLLAVFEPRSATSRRNCFQDAYVEAFAGGDVVFIGSHARLAEVPLAERFKPAQLVTELRARGVLAYSEAEPQRLAQQLVEAAQPGDVMMILSNGDFGGLHAAVLAGLQQRAMATAEV